MRNRTATRPTWSLVLLILGLLCAGLLCAGLLCAGLLLTGAQAAGSTSVTNLRNIVWGWPLQPRPEVLQRFDPPERPWLPGHRGVDLAAAQNQPVLAPTAGVVSYSGWLVDRYVLTIDHGGLRSSFEPVRSELAVNDPVEKGQAIGLVQTGRDNTAEPPEPPPAETAAKHCSSTGSGCLHWGVRREKTYLNPLLFLADRRPSVLLPFEESLIESAQNTAAPQAQTIAEIPVIARAVTKELIS